MAAALMMGTAACPAEPEAERPQGGDGEERETERPRPADEAERPATETISGEFTRGEYRLELNDDGTFVLDSDDFESPIEGRYVIREGQLMLRVILQGTVRDDEVELQTGDVFERTGDGSAEDETED